MRIPRALDFVLYILVGIGLVAAVMLYEESGWSAHDRHAERQQIACCVFGALAIARTSYCYRSHLRSPWFWASILIVLTVQAAALLFALRHKDWELYHWGFPAVGTLYIVDYLMNRFVVVADLRRQLEP